MLSSLVHMLSIPFQSFDFLSALLSALFWNLIDCALSVVRIGFGSLLWTDLLEVLIAEVCWRDLASTYVLQPS